MTIKEIIHKPELGIKQATITLDYDEIRDISNLIYEESKKEENLKINSFNKLRRDMFFLFDLVKNGCIDGACVKKLFDLQEIINKNKL